MAEGLRGEWDARSAERWYRHGSEITDRAPYVLDDIRTGRESTRFNLRDNLRPVDVDWEGYEHTVTTLRRILWQVTGIGRTLVDAADGSGRQPAPSPDFLVRYADALSALAVAVTRLGRHDDTSRRAFDEAIAAALDVLTRLREQVRTTPLDDPEQWPVYGSLISDSLRAVRELEAAGEAAAVPVDTGPVRLPPSSSTLWMRLRRPRSVPASRGRTPGQRGGVQGSLTGHGRPHA
jgi:hypothetical protein